MRDLFNPDAEIKKIGIREGEKMHETLVTGEDLMKAIEYDDYFCIRNLEKIDYDKYFKEGSAGPVPTKDYTSLNTRRLNLEETKELLLSLREIQEELKNPIVK